MKFEKEFKKYFLNLSNFLKILDIEGKKTLKVSENNFENF